MSERFTQLSDVNNWTVLHPALTHTISFETSLTKVNKTEPLIQSDLVTDNSPTKIIPQFVKKIAAQAALTASGFITSNVTTSASVFVGYEVGNKFDFLNNIYDPKTGAALAIAYGINYWTNLKSNKQNVELLEDKKIGVCGNLWQTGINKAGKIFVPKLRRTRQIATFGVGMGMSVMADTVWAEKLWHVQGGIAALTSKELVAAAGGTLWIAINQQVKKRFGEKKVFEANVNKQINTSDEIVATDSKVIPRAQEPVIIYSQAV